MLRTDTLLKCISTAKKTATHDWKNTAPTASLAAADESETVFAAQLRHALKNDELLLYYQPKIDLDSGVISGVEALARWNHPKYGLIYPAAFIPPAELSDLTLPLNTWVLEEACRQMRLWQQNGMANLEVSVNISSACFEMPEFIENVRNALKKYETNPNCFGIELCETAALEDIGKIWEVLNELLKIGVTISVDDVGADYASVARLCNAPINVVKIDNSFVGGLPHNENAAVFVRNILDIAAHANIITLAEGVETKAQFDFLRNYGCDVAQGYLICPPLPVENLETFFDVYNRELDTAGVNTANRSIPATPRPLPNAEEILKSNLNQEKLINTIQAIILSHKDISEAISKALRLLGQYFDACNAYIAETDASTETCSITYEWVRPGQEPLAAALEKIIAGEMNYYALFRAGVLCAGDVAELPETLASRYSGVGCRSVFQAVVIAGGDIVGHIGFTRSTDKTWSQQETGILKSAANIFSAALTRVRAERELTGYYKQMETVLEYVDALIVVIDAQTCEVLFANKKFKQKFSLPEDGQPSRASLYEKGIYQLHAGEPLAVGETLTVEKYNDILEAWLKITSTGINWFDNRSAVLQSAMDITAQKKQEMLIAGMAYEDTLTRIANRRAMEDHLSGKFAQFQKDNEPVCLAMVDIDDFKVVNDTNGHDAGDAILKATADLLKNSVRAEDKVCRWGGEEFVICFGRVSSEGAEQVAERLRKKVEKNIVSFGSKKLSITISIGIAEFHPDDKDYSKALYDADKAMYKSKVRGKNQVTCIKGEISDVSGE